MSSLIGELPLFIGGWLDSELSNVLKSNHLILLCYSLGVQIWLGPGSLLISEMLISVTFKSMQSQTADSQCSDT